MIEIKTKGLKKLNLRLSDELINLDQEIMIKVNGVQKFQGKNCPKGSSHLGLTQSAPRPQLSSHRSY